MAESQARVMAEAMGHADIKIVGGDGQFFDRFVKAVSLGSSIDGVFDNSRGRAQARCGARAGGSGGGNGPAAPTRSRSCSRNLMIKADDSTKTKLKALLDQAKQLGVHDDKVS